MQVDAIFLETLGQAIAHLIRSHPDRDVILERLRPGATTMHPRPDGRFDVMVDGLAVGSIDATQLLPPGLGRRAN